MVLPPPSNYDVSATDAVVGPLPFSLASSKYPSIPTHLSTSPAMWHQRPRAAGGSPFCFLPPPTPPPHVQVLSFQGLLGHLPPPTPHPLGLGTRPPALFGTHSFICLCSLPALLPPAHRPPTPRSPLFQPSLVGPSKGRPAFSLGQESQGLPYGFPESPGYILSLVLAGVSLSLSPTPCPPPPTPLCLPSPAAPLSTSFCSPSLPLPWFSP